MNRPIFIVGMPRSGSTIFYNTLARHPDVAWISEASKKFPRSRLLTQILMRIRKDRRPTEGHRIWRKFARPEDDSLGPEHATPRVRDYYRDIVTMHVGLYEKTRFLSKHPRNVLRLSWLRAIFPDALFLHLLRDGRAVAQSILEMRELHGGRDAYWGVRPPGWRSLQKLDPVEAVARQWRMNIEYARERARALPAGAYLEVRYEDFCERPAETLRQVGRWADLPWLETDLERATRGIESRNYKWRDRLRSEDIDVLERTIGDLLSELGYQLQPWKNRAERSAKSMSGAQ
jgi:omega-hydroxy-beta-dihydromenaquinone-9 sulfotransferase